MDIRRTSFDKHEGSQSLDRVVKRRREQKQRFESTSSVSSDSPSLVGVAHCIPTIII